MKSLIIVVGLVLLAALAMNSNHSIGAQTASAQADGKEASVFNAVVHSNSERTLKEGKQTFRFDTFGDEAWWGDTLHLHEAIEGVKFGGIGPGISPATALSLGLKVDLDALPQSLVQQIKMGKVNLNDPAVTLALLKLNAVVGVTGHFKSDGSLKSVGIQCALCHSTVDNALAPGIGHRLDGWANRDLNVGAIIAASPNLQPIADLLSTDQGTVRKVLNSWGPGKFDAELLLDGKAFRPDSKPAATLIPPAFGLAGINLHTWTGWGSVPHWNALVANLEMHGKGDFYDSRLDDAAQFPIAAANHFGHIQNNPDLITAKLPALHLYQLSIPAPAPPSSSFDHTAADRGRRLFSGKAQCNTCHADPVFTEPGWNMHKASEVCVDAFQANRAPDHGYRTAPLNGVWTHTTGGFYHDGRFATLADVVNHYDACFRLGLTAQEQRDVVEYMKSLPRRN